MVRRVTPERWHRVKEVFEAALEYAPGERSVFLGQACGDDDLLRGEVNSLLISYEQETSFMETPAGTLAAQSLAKEESAALIGQQIDHYQIIREIGRGGMGVVYLAEDINLGRRPVALKLLPTYLTTDPERVRRFEREARAASALNHPNILTIHEIGQRHGRHFIATEFIDGVTVREQMRIQELKLSEALNIAAQIASALVAAHEVGIVHRDIKPENIMIRGDGYVKVLDFGLAKLAEHSSSVTPDEALTKQVRTGSGVIIGTAGYMSPEQVRGRAVDHRADIFSFGAILYEMLSGRRAFYGETDADTTSAVLKEDPPNLSETNQNISPALERLVNHCLEKNPEKRFHSANDLAFALEAFTGSAMSSQSEATVLVRPPARARWRQPLPWLVAGVATMLAALAFALPYFRRVPADVRVTRLFIPPPEKSTLGTLTVSPDGRRLAFIAKDAAGKTLLWVRPLDSLAAQPFAGTDDASYPFWSPDSRFIGFFADGKLKKVEATGGLPNTVCNATNGRGGTWNRDDVIVFAPDPDSGLSRVSASGGESSLLTTLDSSRREDSHRFPQFLPDSRHFLYLARSAQLENRAIYVSALDQPQAKRILGADTNVAYAPPGYLLFPREGTLMAQAFDVASLELTGAPFRIAEQVGYFRRNNEAYFSVSDTSVLIYRSAGMTKTQLVWVDRNGKQLGSPGPPGEYLFPALSPDETRVAIGRVDAHTGTTDIWLLDLARGIPSRLTFDPANDSFPIWSPDGSRIVFASSREGARNLYQKSSSGAGRDEALLKSDEQKIPSDWSFDGRFILYQQISANTEWDLWVLPLFGDRQPIPLLKTKFSELEGVFSPDARWIAYQSNESGSYQVYVQSFPPSGGKWQISSDGGETPRWRRDGKELYYRAANGKLMAVEVKANASSFESRVPKPLFETHSNASYSVTADGQRFLLHTPVEESAPAPITVVMNWAAEVKR